MLTCCWTTVCAVGPTSHQLWFKASSTFWSGVYVMHLQTCKHTHPAASRSLFSQLEVNQQSLTVTNLKLKQLLLLTNYRNLVLNMCKLNFFIFLSKLGSLLCKEGVSVLNITLFSHKCSFKVTLKIPVHMYRPFSVIIGHTENIFSPDNPRNIHSYCVFYRPKKKHGSFQFT